MTTFPSRRDPAPFLTLWLLLCTWLVAGGWLLSAVRMLNPIGYIVLLAAFPLGWRVVRAPGGLPWSGTARRLRRLGSLRRALPLVFVLSALLILVRALMVPPCHDDGLCYHIPRVLHWLHGNGWHWIAAQDTRLNTRGTVYEWLIAPLLLFTHSDRLVFLPNWISHLLLPGVIFRAWRNLGVSRRVAWIWMWLLPAAFCFTLQAGNASNDSLSAFFALAVFALVPLGGQPPGFLALALGTLAAALMVGTKPNAVLLELVVAVALVPWWRVFARQPLATLAVVLTAIMVSFVPTACFNYLHLHDPLGLSQEPNIPRGGPPVELLLGNTSLLLSQNLAPPLLPLVPHWDDALRWWASTPLGHLLARDFEHSPFDYYVQCAVEQAGLGFAVLTAGVLVFLLTRRQLGRVLPMDKPQRLLAHAAIWLVCLVFCCMSTAVQVARLFCANYPLLLAAVFAWRRLAPGRAFRAAQLSAALAMLVSAYCLAVFSENPLVNTWSDLNDFNWRRNADALWNPQLSGRLIPADEQNIGIIRVWNQRESWLWQPYGRRVVQEFPLDATAQTLRARGIRYVVISQRLLAQTGQRSISPWLQSHSAVLEARMQLSDGWFVVRLRDGQTDRP